MGSPGLSVLVIDDEVAMREVLSLRIAGWGHEARTAGDAVAAVQELDRRRPDIVLCDLVLPGMNGMDLLRHIKEQDDTLPVVMITAHGDIDGAVEAMKSGATDFLTKPLDNVTLFALLEATATDVQRARANRSLDAQV